MSVRGNVINLHALGATVRLEDGRLVSVPLPELEMHRSTYARAFERKIPLAFELVGRAVRLETGAADATVVATSTTTIGPDPAFEARIADYLKQTEVWAPTDRPQPFERHLFRKRQRAKQFRGETTP